MTRRARSDLEEAGLRTGAVNPRDRKLLVTVDFEAFTPIDVPRWHAAMCAWSNEASRRNLPSVFFVSVEHVLRLRAADDVAHEQLMSGLQALVEGGSELQPHNHCAFDRENGSALRSRECPDYVPGYQKRPSMFFDVVHINGIPIREWIPAVLSVMADLRKTVAHPPVPIAFRPGGWDSGSKHGELAAYIEALAANDVCFDSSASRGRYGTRSWRVGLPFGRNVFRVGSLVEVAPTGWWNCGASVLSVHTASALGRLIEQPHLYFPPRWPGICSPVLHFDHLIRASSSTVGAAENARRVVRVLAVLSDVLRMEPATFGSLGLVNTSVAGTRDAV